MFIYAFSSSGSSSISNWGIPFGPSPSSSNPGNPFVEVSEFSSSPFKSSCSTIGSSSETFTKTLNDVLMIPASLLILIMIKRF